MSFQQQAASYSYEPQNARRPENGSPEALEHADYVVRSNNDGTVANVIEILDNIL